eukprot:401505-Hanusia_phi.AAC.1
MRQSLVDEWSQHVLLLNVYGVTECAVYQSCSRVRSNEDYRSIGRAIGENQLLLVAGDGSDPSRLVEEGSGEEGEIWIAGPQVGMGYLLLPQLTQERFISHPTLGCCFRTGDVACSTGGGWILRGRRDNQVKINGKRVELGETEDVVASFSCPLLSSCVIVPVVYGEKLVLAAVCKDAMQTEADAMSGRAAEEQERRAFREQLLKELIR